mmetsp:Transcript_47300/g.124025  ORF Transcript_47300/g.124025 Transcript_47300/m.124025 type:complete len:253 (+) Transcript_47300:101-859(+)
MRWAQKKGSSGGGNCDDEPLPEERKERLEYADHRSQRGQQRDQSPRILHKCLREPRGEACRTQHESCSGCRTWPSGRSEGRRGVRTIRVRVGAKERPEELIGVAIAKCCRALPIVGSSCTRAIGLTLRVTCLASAIAAAEIVHAALLRIIKDSKCSTDTFESLIRSADVALVWMKAHRQLPVCFLEVSFRGAGTAAEHSIVGTRSASQDSSHLNSLNTHIRGIRRLQSHRSSWPADCGSRCPRFWNRWQPAG